MMMRKSMKSINFVLFFKDNNELQNQKQLKNLYLQNYNRNGNKNGV